MKDSQSTLRDGRFGVYNLMVSQKIKKFKILTNKQTKNVFFGHFEKPEIPRVGCRSDGSYPLGIQWRYQNEVSPHL